MARKSKVFFFSLLMIFTIIPGCVFALDPPLLKQPAKRMVTFAPSLTELVFAAGAQKKLVGVSAYSDYPSAAKKIPVVADYTGPDLEKLLALKPDLVLAWSGGTSDQVMSKIKALHIPVCSVDIQKMEDVPQTIKAIGFLAGTQAIANKSADQFLNQYNTLRSKYENKPEVTVFYQLSNQPLLTLNKQSLVNEIITDCGGKNVFADAIARVPEVDMAAILKVQPDVIIASKNKVSQTDPVAFWSAWSGLLAVQKKHIFTVDADLIERPGPRAILAMTVLCQEINQAR